VGIASDDAARLQASVEHWQALAAEQQRVSLDLERLIGAQLALMERWSAAGGEDLGEAAASIQTHMRAVADEVLGIQEAVLRKIAGAVADAGRVIREH
jgi:hypothetical protein